MHGFLGAALRSRPHEREHPASTVPPAAVHLSLVDPPGTSGFSNPLSDATRSVEPASACSPRTRTFGPAVGAAAIRRPGARASRTPWPGLADPAMISAQKTLYLESGASADAMPKRVTPDLRRLASW